MKHHRYIYITSKATYCDQGPSLWHFQFMSYLPFIDLKNGFWPVVPILCGISWWNFTNMLVIKSYILWLRSLTLTFSVHELSAHNRSEKWFLTYQSFTIWIIWMKLHKYIFNIKGYILWQRTFTLTLLVYEFSDLDRSKKVFLTCNFFTMWYILMKLLHYVYHQRLHIVTKDRQSDLSISWVICPW